MSILINYRLEWHNMTHSVFDVGTVQWCRATCGNLWCPHIFMLPPLKLHRWVTHTLGLTYYKTHFCGILGDTDTDSYSELEESEKRCFWWRSYPGRWMWRCAPTCCWVGRDEAATPERPRHVWGRDTAYRTGSRQPWTGTDGCPDWPAGKRCRCELQLVHFLSLSAVIFYCIINKYSVSLLLCGRGGRWWTV